MQAQPYLVAEGKTLGHRVVNIEPREVTRPDGTSFTTKAQKYQEVGVAAPACYDGALADTTAVLTIRIDLDETPPEKGADVRWAVTSRVMKAWINGRFADWVVLDKAADLGAVGVRRVAAVS